MDKISNLANNVNQALQNGQQRPVENGSATTPPPRLIINLWERMAHIYGHKWTSAHGESGIEKNELTEVARTWATGLRGVTGEQIAVGLRACIDRLDDWPPTLPEFKRLCLGKNNPFGLGYTPEVYRDSAVTVDKRLSGPEREARKEVNNERLKGCRDILRGRE